MKSVVLHPYVLIANIRISIFNLISRLYIFLYVSIYINIYLTSMRQFLASKNTNQDAKKEARGKSHEVRGRDS